MFSLADGESSSSLRLWVLMNSLNGIHFLFFFSFFGDFVNLDREMLFEVKLGISNKYYAERSTDSKYTPTAVCFSKVRLMAVNESR